MGLRVVPNPSPSKTLIKNISRSSEKKVTRRESPVATVTSPRSLSSSRGSRTKVVLTSDDDSDGDEVDSFGTNSGRIRASARAKENFTRGKHGKKKSAEISSRSRVNYDESQSQRSTSQKRKITEDEDKDDEDVDEDEANMIIRGRGNCKRRILDDDDDDNYNPCEDRITNLTNGDDTKHTYSQSSQSSWI